MTAGANLADGLLQVAVPLLAVGLTTAPAGVATVAVAGRLPWLLLVLHAGVLVDRIDRRHAMLAANTARVLLFGILTLLTATGHLSIWLLSAVAFGAGVAEVVNDTAAQSILPAVVDRARLTWANGRLQAAELACNLFAGPPLGGLLLATSVILAPAAATATYLTAVGLLASLPGTFRPPGGPVRSLRHDLAEGLRALWRQGLLRTLALCAAVQNLANAALVALLPLYATTAMGLSAGGYGLLIAAAGLSGIAASTLAAPLAARMRRGRLLAVCTLGAAVGFAAPSLTARPLLVGAGFVVSAGASVVWNVVAISWRQELVADRLLGRVNASFRLFSWGALSLGAATAGVVGELVGIRPVFAIGGLLTAATAAPIALTAARHSAGQRSTPRPP